VLRGGGGGKSGFNHLKRPECYLSPERGGRGRSLLTG